MSERPWRESAKTDLKIEWKGETKSPRSIHELPYLELHKKMVWTILWSLLTLYYLQRLRLPKADLSSQSREP
jgi:hypothetical protein